jgi:hypothetical protein
VGQNLEVTKMVSMGCASDTGNPTTSPTECRKEYSIQIWRKVGEKRGWGYHFRSYGQFILIIPPNSIVAVRYSKKKKDPEYLEPGNKTRRKLLGEGRGKTEILPGLPHCGNPYEI